MSLINKNGKTSHMLNEEQRYSRNKNLKETNLTEVGRGSKLKSPYL